MALFVGLLLIATAAATVGVVFWYVLNEKHEHYEHYIPELDAANAPAQEPSNTESSASQ